MRGSSLRKTTPRSDKPPAKPVIQGRSAASAGSQSGPPVSNDAVARQRAVMMREKDAMRRAWFKQGASEDAGGSSAAPAPAAAPSAKPLTQSAPIAPPPPPPPAQPAHPGSYGAWQSQTGYGAAAPRSFEEMAAGVPRTSNPYGYESTSMAGYGVPPPPPAAASDEVLTRLSERISTRLREELSNEIRREMEFENEKRSELAGKLESYLSTELQTHTCPICVQLMLPPNQAPIMLFPCGHTFCNLCVDKYLSRGSRNCPFCKHPIESRAVNQPLKALIETFATKKASLERAATGLKSAEPMRTNTLAAAGAEHVRYRPPTGPGMLQTSHAAPGYDVDTAAKYVHDYNSFAMRYQILANEYRDSMESAATMASRVQACDASMGHLEGEKRAAEARLAQVQAELQLIEQHMEKQRQQRKQLSDEHAAAVTNIQTITETMSGLQRDMEKSKLFVENFAPQLLGHLQRM